MKKLQAWHFVAKNKRLGYDDGTIVAPGCTYSVQGPVELCRWGLHASVKPLDALRFAPGPIVCRVELSGQIKTASDKAVATRREVLWMADATNVLHEFVCQAAEQVLNDASVTDAQCWAAINAKRRWLKDEITDQELAAARAAVKDAARAAAWDAARDAARAAAWVAARPVVWDVTWAVANDRRNAMLTSLLMELAS